MGDLMTYCSANNFSQAQLVNVANIKKSLNDDVDRFCKRGGMVNVCQPYMPKPKPTHSAPTGKSARQRRLEAMSRFSCARVLQIEQWVSEKPNRLPDLVLQMDMTERYVRNVIRGCVQIDEKTWTPFRKAMVLVQAKEMRKNKGEDHVKN